MIRDLCQNSYISFYTNARWIFSLQKKMNTVLNIRETIIFKDIISSEDYVIINVAKIVIFYIQF